VDSFLVTVIASAASAVLTAAVAVRWVTVTRRRQTELRAEPGAVLAPGSRWRDGVAADTLPPVPSELVTACAAGECVLFVGSGIGAQVGLPAWTELLSQLARQTSTDAPGAHFEEAAESLAGRPWLLADLIRENMQRTSLIATLRDTFDRPVGSLSTLGEILGQIPFSSALSTSWDQLPEAIFADRSPRSLTLADEEELTRRFREKKFTILRINGDLRQPDTVLLTADELSRTFYENPAQTRTLLSVILTRTILFIGLSSEGIAEFFDAFPTYIERGSRMHYALVPRGLDTAAREQLFGSRYGIQLLPYNGSAGHPELTYFVDKLRSEISAEIPEVSAPALKQAEITAIKLDNIGPFEHLELGFEHGWTVLLGNNGSGKSTLLRAIALGICGDDRRATEAGAQLLRDGARRGAIELRIGGDTYRTDLIRDQNRVVVRCQQVTPLLAGVWLVLGFPPLRGAAGTRPSGLSERGFGSPVVDDLLPILLSPVDQRLGNIKQWLVNLELDQTSGPRGQELRKAFFRLIDKLTPGLRFEYKGLSDDYDVLVRTDDGVVPIEMISQGTSSVLNWCGTLLQRMYEVYADAEHPEQESAVVLIDEVDAHMHPEWQRQFVTLMQDVFPNLQVIATTHSPLVVGNLDAGHVVAMRRNSEGVAAKVIPAEMRGWGTDDILTGPGFDMSTAREPETELLQDEYSKLFAKADRTDQENARLKELSEQLTPRLLQPLSPRGQAQTLFTQWLDDKWAAQPPDQRERILRESRLYMAQFLPDDEGEEAH
jgi:AAA domain, putative AbiEii toxin, Type IV TA system/AAA domain/SIR2-like domain